MDHPPIGTFRVTVAAILSLIFLALNVQPANGRIVQRYRFNRPPRYYLSDYNISNVTMTQTRDYSRTATFSGGPHTSSQSFTQDRSRSSTATWRRSLSPSRSHSHSKSRGSRTRRTRTAEPTLDASLSTTATPALTHTPTTAVIFVFFTPSNGSTIVTGSAVFLSTLPLRAVVYVSTSLNTTFQLYNPTLGIGTPMNLTAGNNVTTNGTSTNSSIRYTPPMPIPFWINVSAMFPNRANLSLMAVYYLLPAPPIDVNISPAGTVPFEFNVSWNWYVNSSSGLAPQNLLPPIPFNTSNTSAVQAFTAYYVNALSVALGVNPAYIHVNVTNVTVAPTGLCNATSNVTNGTANTTSAPTANTTSNTTNATLGTNNSTMQTNASSFLMCNNVILNVSILFSGNGALGYQTALATLLRNSTALQGLGILGSVIETSAPASPNTTTPAPTPALSSSSTLPGWAIAIIVIFGLIGVGLVTFGIITLLRHLESAGVLSGGSAAFQSRNAAANATGAGGTEMSKSASPPVVHPPASNQPLPGAPRPPTLPKVDEDGKDFKVLSNPLDQWRGPGGPPPPVNGGTSGAGPSSRTPFTNDAPDDNMHRLQANF